jgi:hypothetical protein
VEEPTIQSEATKEINTEEKTNSPTIKKISPFLPRGKNSDSSIS